MQPVTVGIILARSDSRRLTRKVLQPLRGIPLMSYVLQRAQHISGLSSLVLATTDRPIDDDLADYVQRQGVAVYRGDADDVARRTLDCARAYDADYFVRLNGDSPFLDPALIDDGIRSCQEHQVDLVTNLIGRTFPYGISVEIIRTAAFAQAYAQMSRQDEREHVTLYLYNHPERFAIHTLTAPDPKWSHARLVVDTPEDVHRCERVLARLGDDALRANYQQVAALYLEDA
jgi:spore coat polysaccharide biosynthesis protein SpsF